MIRLILIGILVVIILAILLRRKQPPPLLDEIQVIDTKDEMRPKLRASEEDTDPVDLRSERDEQASEKGKSS